MPTRRIHCLLIALLAAAAPVLARELTFEQRIEAQRAIERVYYSHQIGATQPFGEAVSREALEQKVRTYLAQSVALETRWNTPVTAEMLQRELERMARGTRLPERLRQLYAALGHDSFLIQECLVRPTLVDRLARSRFAYDPTIHAESRKAAEALWAEVATGKRNPSVTDPRRTLVELSPEDFQKQRARFPRKAGEVGRLADERAAFVFRVVLDEKPRGIHVASFAVPKTSWAEWWEGVRGTFGQVAVMTVASEISTLPESACQPDDLWANGVLDDSPDPAELHTAVWTGSRMIVWGGTLYYSGSSYDPATDSWTPTSTTGAPSPRLYHTAVWSGSRMIVWGGVDIWGSPVLDTGGRYDPLTDTWTPTSSTDAPSPRQGHVAVWAGDRMVVWGGGDAVSSLSTGGQYDPAADSWVPTSTTSAPSPRKDPTAVWTGSRMIVWGGHDGSAVLGTGGQYDPVTNSWTATTTAGAPPPLMAYTAVWTGNRMIVCGGTGNPWFLAGGLYDPVANSWTSMAPLAHGQGHTAVWTGNRMIVWGGFEESGTPHGAGSLYDPVTNSWTQTSTIGAPFPRTFHTAVWTGSRMIVWGGRDESYHNSNTGGVYDPLANNWVPTSTTSAPSPRFRHTAVWTGSRMIVWGGADYEFAFDTGGVYDAVTDSWSVTSTIGAPAPRTWHTAVWTGSRMVVWGGSGDPYPDLDTGGLYDPLLDQWTATSTAGAPVPRIAHTAVWTGSRMIVWGGFNQDIYDDLDTGGLYDPATDSWTPTSAIEAPSPRSQHSAIWTDSQMIVWGGWRGSSTLDTGSRYDPVTDSWEATSLTGAPVSRVYQAAVWTGSRMIVWGGYNGYESVFLNTGALYDPVANGWTPTSTTGPPSHRAAHTAVATEDGMIVWGGICPGAQCGTGGRYVLGGFVDGEGDGYGVCSAACADAPACGDNCPVAYNPCQEDADLDGAGDACDCAPQDPLDGPPVEVGDTLALAKAVGSTVLSWSDEEIAGPFRLYRGGLDAGNAWVYNHGCVGAAITATSTADSLEPSPSSLFYYLVARQGCGESVPGRDSTGTPIPNANPCSGAGAGQ